MSSSDDSADQASAAYGELEAAARTALEIAEKALNDGTTDQISDEVVQRLLTAGTRLFANKVEEVLADDKTSKGLKFSETDVHIVCPWHGYEYNLKTGRHPGDKNVRLKPYEVKISDGEVYVIV